MIQAQGLTPCTLDEWSYHESIFEIFSYDMVYPEEGTLTILDCLFPIFIILH